MTAHYRRISSPDKWGVQIRDHAAGPIDFQRDETKLGAIRDSDFGRFVPGKDATVVIHEATLEDGLEAEAVEKRHRWV